MHALTGAYVCDALEPEERRELEEHLRECGPCAQEVAEFRAVAAVLGAALAVPPPDRLLAAVRANLAVTRQQRTAAARLRRLLTRFRQPPWSGGELRRSAAS